MKKKKQKYTDEQLEIVSDSGRTNFPIEDMCRLVGISVGEFAEDEELQSLYRINQLRTQLAIRRKLVDDAITDGSIKSIKLFIENFYSPTLPDVNDMPDDDEQ